MNKKPVREREFVCKRCGEPYTRRAWKSDWCDECRMVVREEWVAERKAKGKQARTLSDGHRCWSNMPYEVLRDEGEGAFERGARLTDLDVKNGVTLGTFNDGTLLRNVKDGMTYLVSGRVNMKQTLLVVA